MELEAANLWLHGDLNLMIKKISSKNIYFFLSKIFLAKNIFELKKYFFENRKNQKFSLKINIKNFEKVEKISIFSRFFQLFWKMLYWCSMKIFEFFEFQKNIFRKSQTFFDFFFRSEKNNIFWWIFFLSSKSWRVLCTHKFSASNSIYKNMKTQGQKKLDRN